MALRNGHGNGAGAPRIEVLPPDELPRGTPAPASAPEPAPVPAERGPSGRLVAGQAARELARRGGIAKAAKARELRALHGLGLRGTPDVLAPYLADAMAFAAREVQRLAENVGGGVCGAAASSMVQTAALQLAGSRAAFEQGDLKLGSQLGNDSRQNLLAAHEIAAREAEARLRKGKMGPGARFAPLKAFDAPPRKAEST